MPTQAHRVAPIAGVLGLLASVAWASSWTGGGPSVVLEVLATLGTAGPWALLWFAGAAGLGWPLARAISDASAGERAALQVACGVAAMLVIDAAFGALGWLTPAIAWLLAAGGAAATGVQLALAARKADDLAIAPRLWLAAPAIAALVVAATVPPGTLWATEFGGYDALSYHVQLPKEWAAAGSMTPSPHNVYGWLPSYVEASTLHLVQMTGDTLTAALAAQLLQALIACAAALAIGALAGRLCGDCWRVTAALLAIGTPWLVVVGSLAYVEAVVVLVFVSAWLAVEIDGRASVRAGAIVGLLVGAACGAKLTSVALVAAPIVVLLAASRAPLGARLMRLAAFAACSAIVLTPWLVRNQVAGGNPVFPFATDVFGTAHWSAEQAAIWTDGHAADGVGARLVGAFNEYWRFGLGPAPASDPWRAQWLVLPWLGLIGALVALRSQRRRAAVLTLVVFGVQLVLWIALTHVKSRFMLPSLATCVVGVTLGGAAVLHGTPRPWTRGVMLAVLGLWCAAPLLFLRGEAGGAPAARIGLIRGLVGDGLTTQERRQVGLTNAIVFINHLLDDDAHVLLVGDATPFYYDADVTYQTTWDRGPMSRAMDAHGDDMAACWRTLGAAGFTHVFVDPAMLDRWIAAGWADERLTGARMIEAGDAHGELVCRFPGGRALYALPAR